MLAYGVNTMNPLESKLAALGSFGKPSYPPTHPTDGGAIYGPFGAPTGGFGATTGGFGGYPTGGILPPELEKKASVVLPLAGAALLGKNYFKYFISILFKILN